MITDAIRQAEMLHRQVMEAAYDGVCTVYEQQDFEDPETHDTVFREVQVQGEIPCHLSYSSVPALTAGVTGAAVSQVVKLFLAPELEIRPGSRLEVTQQGKTECYSRSGQPAVYASHQEIELSLFKEYA